MSSATAAADHCLTGHATTNRFFSSLLFPAFSAASSPTSGPALGPAAVFVSGTADTSATPTPIASPASFATAAEAGRIVARKPHITTLVHFSIPPPDGSVAVGNLKDFTYFNKLPIELRFKIWKLAIPNRLLTVINKTKHYPDGTCERAIAVRQPLRTLSFVCHEAHAVTSKLYIPVRHHYLGWTLTYAPSADTFYFPGWFEDNPDNLSVCKFGNDVKAMGYPMPSIAFDEEIIGPMYTGRGFVFREELILVIGKATTTCRTKVLVPGVKTPKGGGKWGKGDKVELERRAARIDRLREEMEILLQQEKRIARVLKMPILKLMVVCEKEAGVAMRRVLRRSY